MLAIGMTAAPKPNETEAATCWTEGTEDTGRQDLTYPCTGREIPLYARDGARLDMSTNRSTCGCTSAEGSLALSSDLETRRCDLTGLPFFSIPLPERTCEPGTLGVTLGVWI